MKDWVIIRVEDAQSSAVPMACRELGGFCPHRFGVYIGELKSSQGEKKKEKTVFSKAGRKTQQ